MLGGALVLLLSALVLVLSALVLVLSALVLVLAGALVLVLAGALLGGDRIVRSVAVYRCQMTRAVLLELAQAACGPVGGVV